MRSYMDSERGKQTNRKNATKSDGIKVPLSDYNTCCIQLLSPWYCEQVTNSGNINRLRTQQHYVCEQQQQQQQQDTTHTARTHTDTLPATPDEERIDGISPQLLNLYLEHCRHIPQECIDYRKEKLAKAIIPKNAIGDTLHRTRETRKREAAPTSMATFCMPPSDEQKRQRFRCMLNEPLKSKMNDTANIGDKSFPLLARYMRQQMELNKTMNEIYCIDFYNTNTNANSSKDDDNNNNTNNMHDDSELFLRACGIDGIIGIKHLRQELDKLGSSKTRTLKTQLQQDLSVYLIQLLHMPAKQLIDHLETLYLSGALDTIQLRMIVRQLLLFHKSQKSTAAACNLRKALHDLQARMERGELPQYSFNMRSLQDLDLLRQVMSQRPSDYNMQQQRLLRAFCEGLAELRFEALSRYLHYLIERKILNLQQIAQLVSYMQSDEGAVNLKCVNLAGLVMSLEKITQDIKLQTLIPPRRKEIDKLQKILRQKSHIWHSKHQLFIKDMLGHMAMLKQSNLAEFLSEQRLPSSILKKLFKLAKVRYMEQSTTKKEKVKERDALIGAIRQAKHNVHTVADIAKMQELLRSSNMWLKHHKEDKFVGSFVDKLRCLKEPQLKSYITDLIKSGAMDSAAMEQLVDMLKESASSGAERLANVIGKANESIQLPHRSNSVYSLQGAIRHKMLDSKITENIYQVPNDPPENNVHRQSLLAKNILGSKALLELEGKLHQRVPNDVLGPLMRMLNGDVLQTDDRTAILNFLRTMAKTDINKLTTLMRVLRDDLMNTTNAEFMKLISYLLQKGNNTDPALAQAISKALKESRPLDDNYDYERDSKPNRPYKYSFNDTATEMLRNQKEFFQDIDEIELAHLLNEYDRGQLEDRESLEKFQQLLARLHTATESDLAKYLLWLQHRKMLSAERAYKLQTLIKQPDTLRADNRRIHVQEQLKEEASRN